MTEAQYVGSVATRYNSADALDHPMNRVVHHTWLSAIGNLQGMTALDLACGGGHSSRLLAKRGARVTGVDISSDMIKHAEEIETAYPLGIQYYVGDAARLNFGREFDIVTPSFLFHYAATRDELSRYMETTYRHVRRGGRMIALNAWKSIISLVENAGHWSELVNPEEGFFEGARVRLYILDSQGRVVCPIEYFHWEPETYVQLMQECGFKNIQRIHHQVPLELRGQYANWQQLESMNASCVITAEKE